MLGLVGDAGVVDQDDGAVELHHQVAAGVQHGLGVLGAVLVAGKESVQGIDHDDFGGLGQHPDVLDHLEVTGWCVEVAAVLGEPHVELA